MRRVRELVAGLDVHRDSVVACAEVPEGGEVVVHKDHFATTTAGVAKLAEWLADLGVVTVVMEATGVYWEPVYYGLEGLLEELWLCNAQHVKNVPGRKTDMADAEWLADVAAHGMVRPSLVPEPVLRELRELTCYRKSLVDERVREVQRLEKTLQDAGIKLSSVASRVMTQSTRAMVEALIRGERDPKVLAQLAKSRMRSKIPALEEALVGRFSAHHAVVATQVLAHIDFLGASIAHLDAAVRERMALPKQRWTARRDARVGTGDRRGVPGRDGRRHEAVPNGCPPGFVVPHLPGQQRVGRQAQGRGQNARQDLARPCPNGGS